MFRNGENSDSKKAGFRSERSHAEKDIWVTAFMRKTKSVPLNSRSRFLRTWIASHLLAKWGIFKGSMVCFTFYQSCQFFLFFQLVCDVIKHFRMFLAALLRPQEVHLTSLNSPTNPVQVSNYQYFPTRPGCGPRISRQWRGLVRGLTRYIFELDAQQAEQNSLHGEDSCEMCWKFSKLTQPASKLMPYRLL